MQNLCLTNTRTVSLSDLTGANTVRRFAIDSDKQILYLLTSSSIYSLTLENEQIQSIYSSSNSTVTTEDLCFLSELNHLIFGLSNGDLLSLQFEDEYQENVNVIGTLEECIHELKSSPDQQILVAVTNSKVLLLSPHNDYEPIAENVLDTADFGEQQLVNVGWGSKTTQFHGSAGKKAAIEPMNTAPIRLRSEYDDDRSHIAWRDDGDLFAVSFISLKNQWRTIKIYNKQGHLQATNESSLNGYIESTFAWKISGELIGAAMRFNNGQKLTISFVEKNGLKHGELVLDTQGNQQQYVEHLAWNKDSSILAIVLRQENQSTLQLWSSSNYHWYLKQTFPLETTTNIQAILWDLDIANKLHLITNQGQYQTMTWSWTSQVSYTNTRSLVFHIDGTRLLVSDFTHSSIPPPMSSYEILSPKSILAIAFDDDSDQLVLILSDRSLAICGHSSGLKDFQTINHLSGIKSVHYVTSILSPSASPIQTLQNATHFRLINNKFYFIENSQLHIYNLQTQTKTSLNLSFNCLTTAIDHEQIRHLYLQDEHGKIYRLDQNELHAKMHFPRPCSHFSVVLNGQYLGLTENYRLYLNTIELAHNCNSYFIHDQTILVYSTLQHQLVFRSLTNEQQTSEISYRRTERGTRIVCTAYTNLKLILQMPRGNLETIYPRPLLLTYISSELLNANQKNYQRAFELMRKNRLNLNFLYDYNPLQFIENISSFISQMRSDDDICLFLSEIDNEKNTRNEYIKYILKSDQNLFIDQQQQQQQQWYPKANLICEKFRSFLQTPANMNSILTSFIKQSPPNMEGALKFLNQHPQSFDSAIRYLTYFIDIDRLYDIALGTYNFDLVLMISEKTQKDPKEYLPELNQLRSINHESWRKFRIDCRLKRFKKAIENACDYFIEQLINQTTETDGKFQEFLNILETNRLYKLAIKQFLSNKQIQSTMKFIKDILQLYGDYLMTKKYYIEAGLVYERGEFYQLASQAFRQGKDVQNSLKLVSCDQSQSISNNTDQYRSLAEQFRHDSLFVDSGQIYEYYLHDSEEAFLSYIQGHEWSHIIRLFFTTLKSRRDLYEHEFLSTFNSFYDDIEKQLKIDYEKFDNYFKRLMTLRTNLFQHIKEVLDSGHDYDIDENDDQSDNDDGHLPDDRRTMATRTNVDDSGSIRTRLTKKSGSISSSKKSQRRAAQQQEKLVQLKEGSKHEDLALVRELWLLITKFDKLNSDIRHVNKICYQISTHENSLVYEQKGESLQNKYQEILNAIEKQLTTIWLTNPDQQQENVQVLVIKKKIREKFKKDLDLISNQYRVSPSLNSKLSQWKLVLFDSDVTV